MVARTCAFQTERLAVADWHVLPPDALSAFVMALLTPATTAPLPPAWHGAYDDARAQRWIAERDSEGTVLLAMEAGSPVGLLLLFEESDPEGRSLLRVGYLIAEAAAGRGLGTELLAGLVAWSRGQPTVRALIGGVEPGNAASIRILEKCGFRLDTTTGSAALELEYRLDL